MKSSFKKSDCIFLLKDLTGIINFTPFDKKESLISQGVNYSEMITEEAPLTNEVNEIFKETLQRKSSELAHYVAVISEQIFLRGKENCIIVSLARAGSPIGALVKRYILKIYDINLPHYSISIIRDKGIDGNALNYILNKHPKGIITFVDGWTGKGSITQELKNSVAEYNLIHGTNVSADLAVLADPAHISAIAGTYNDICIPNACLNSTISGLVSRTILNKSFINMDEFHGAVRYENLAPFDFTNIFLNAVENEFKYEQIQIPHKEEISCISQITKKIKSDFPLIDINKIKLSIGESSRALLRRIPQIVLIKNPDNPDLSFVLHLARLKKVEIRVYDTMDYECIALLK